MKTRLLIIIAGCTSVVAVFGLMAIVYMMTGMDLGTAYHYYFVNNGCTQVGIEFSQKDAEATDHERTKFLQFTENDLQKLPEIRNMISKINDKDEKSMTVLAYVTEAEWMQYWNYFKSSYNKQYESENDLSFSTYFEYNGIKYFALFPIC